MSENEIKKSKINKLNIKNATSVFILFVCMITSHGSFIEIDGLYTSQVIRRDPRLLNLKFGWSRYGLGK